MSIPETPRPRRAVVVVTATLTALAMVAGVVVLMGAAGSPSQAATAQPSAAGPQAAEATAPAQTLPPTPSASTPVGSAALDSLDGIRNVVFILADDLDWELFEAVPRLAALKDLGTTFTRHTVTDSLCCPSRVSILRGQYVHNHAVVSNMAASGGGWPTFRDSGREADCLPVWLQDAGLTTALFGKYLNEYPSGPRTAAVVPPGWSEWAVPVSRGDSYSGYDYTLNENGALVRHGSSPEDFLNDVLTARAVSFIGTAPEGFFLELSTYNPHKPAPVADRNKGTHAATVVPRGPSYNATGTNEPTWLQAIGPISPWKQWKLDQRWRQRAESAESVADSVESVLAELRRTGRDQDTLVVITSDNGYHAGAHRLGQGKRTAFREDTVVPLVVIGPGVAAGATVDAITSTVDLAPTFTDILGAQAPAWVDGRSLEPLIATGQAPAGWRTAALSESLGASMPGDPDYQTDAPPPFTALRTTDWLFVVYRDGERELYDLTRDPFELNNVIDSAPANVVAQLYSQMQAMRACAGDTCRTADSLPAPS